MTRSTLLIPCTGCSRLWTDCRNKEEFTWNKSNSIHFNCPLDTKEERKRRSLRSLSWFLEQPFFDYELRTAHHFLLGPAKNTGLAIVEIRHAQSFFNLQRTRFALSVSPFPVEKAKRRVAVLLDLDEKVAAADAMQPPAWSKKGIAFFHRDFMHQADRLACAHRRFELSAIDATFETEINFCVVSRGEHVPHLGLTSGASTGMDLERERLPGIEQLGQDRKTRPIASIIAKDVRAMLSPELMQGLAFPGTLPNDTLRFLAVNNLPRFANQFSRRKLFPKLPGELVSAPDSLHEKRLKNKRLREHRFHRRRA